MDEPTLLPEPIPAAPVVEPPAPPDHAVEAATDAKPQGEPEPEEEPHRRRRKLVLLLLLILIALVGLFGLWYAIYRKPASEFLPTLTQQIPPHYLYSIYGATQPVGVAVTPDGSRVYVSESGGTSLVKVFDAKGAQLGVLKPPNDNKMHQPVYASIDPQTLEVYVTDRPTGSIYIYDASGKFVRSYTPADPIKNWQPIGMAFAPDGSLWVTDVSDPFHRVEQFDRQGALLRTIGTAGQLNFPNGVAVSAAGDLYVTDSNNGRLLVMDGQGRPLASIGRGTGEGMLGLPRGVAVDDAGRLYVVDTTGQTVHRYLTRPDGKPEPKFLDDLGSPGAGDGQFQYPNDVAVDTRGHVFIADRENNRVQVWGY